MAVAMLADELAKTLNVNPAATQTANAFERVPCELITKIIAHFAAVEIDAPFAFRARTPSEALSHKTLTSRSLTCKGLHILTEPFLHCEIRPASVDNKSWQRYAKQLARSAKANSDRSRFRHARLLTMLVHVTDVELLDNLLSVITDLKSLHLRVDTAYGQGQVTLDLTGFFTFSHKATTTLAHVTRLDLDLLRLTAAFRQVYLRSTLRYFTSLQMLRIQGAAPGKSAAAPPRSIKTKTKVNHLLLSVGNPDMGQPNFKASLECIDTTSVEILALKWDTVPASDSLALADDPGKTWKSLRIVHLLGPDPRIPAFDNSAHAFTAEILTWLTKCKQVHTLRFDASFMSSTYYDVSSVLATTRPSVTALELGWPCGGAVLALDQLCDRGQLFTSALACIQTIRFVTSFGERPGETWHYNAQYVRMMRESFDSITIRKWLGGRLKRLADHFESRGKTVEPASFWTDLGTNLGRMLDDPSLKMSPADFERYWADREAEKH